MVGEGDERPAAGVNERLAALTEAGTSVWLDQIRRSLIEAGELAAAGRRGLAARRDLEPGDLREGDPRLRRLRRPARASSPSEGRDARGDLRRASRSRTCSWPPTCCAPSTTRPAALDGFVSLEVEPDLAHDTDGDARAGARVLAARRPPERDDQDPGHRRGRARRSSRRSTRASTSTSRCCSRSRPTSRSPRRFIRGLERRHEEGKARRALRRVSFFVSRVDSEVDKRLEELGRTRPAGARPRSPTRAPPTSASRRSSRASASPKLARGRRAGAAAAVGVDRRQEPALPGHDVRRRARRAATPSTRCRCRRCSPPPSAPRSRAPRPTSGPEPPSCDGARRGRHRHGRRHRQAAARGHRRVRQPMEKLLAGIEQAREAVVTGRPPTIERSIPDELEPRDRRDGSSEASASDVARRDLAQGRRRSGATAGTPEVADRLGWLTISEPMLEQADDLEAFADEVKRGRLHRLRAARHGRLVASRPR